MHIEKEHPDRFIEIYEQYKRLCARMISDIVLNKINLDKRAAKMHDSLIKEFQKIDFAELTVEQAERLDMRRFNDYEEYITASEVLVLFPLWMLPVIPKNTELRNIFGEVLVLDDDQKLVSTDTRSGLLAYGIMNYQLRYKKVLMEKYKPTPVNPLWTR